MNMNYVRRVALILLTIGIFNLFTGCGLIDDISWKLHERAIRLAEYAEYDEVERMISETTELNERQKYIMAMEIGRTEYSELKDDQKEAAIKIEMLYEYLEEKYPDKEFEYVNFLLDPLGGTLIVRENSDDKHREVGAWMTWDNKLKEYEYEDEYYLMVTASDEYEKLIEKHLKEYNPNANFFLDIEVKYVDDENQKVTIKNAGGCITIIVEDMFESEEEAKHYIEGFADWLRKNNNYEGGLLRLIVLDGKTFEAVRGSNSITSFIFDVEITYDIFCEITSDNELRFW